jgi:hypothetical protein
LVTDAVSSTNANIVTAGNTSTLIILNALVANKTSTSANVDLYLVTDSGDDVYLLKSVPVPAGSSLELITGSKIILESSDVLRGRADTASALDLTISYLDQT